LAEFIYDGHYQRHRTRMQAIYAERRTRLVELMHELTGIEIAPAQAGLHVVVPLPSSIDDRALSLRAADAGVIAPPLSTHYLTPAARRGLLLGFGVADVRSIEKSAPVLARCIASVTAARARCVRCRAPRASFPAERSGSRRVREVGCFLAQARS